MTLSFTTLFTCPLCSEYSVDAAAACDEYWNEADDEDDNP